MKYIEYGCYDLATNENEIKELIKKVVLFKPSCISVLPYYVKHVKPLINHSHLSTIIDYPFGVSDSTSRLVAVEEAIKDGVDSVELVMNSSLLCNRKYDKIRKELEIFSNLCLKHNIVPKCILEYKLFSLDLIYKSCSILNEYSIDTIYPSANFLIDNISDNILAGMLILKKNPKMFIVFNGSAWTDDHIDMLTNNNILAYRASNIYTLEKLHKKINKIS
jgi:deoxyribose-phosphate aldolase